MNRPNLILDAAVKVFAKRGFEQASVDDIAREAKVAKGTLYYHFVSKDEILSSLIERGIKDFSRVLKEEIQKETDPVKQLEIMIKTQVDLFYQHRDFCRILLREMWQFEMRWKQHVELMQQNYIALIKSVIESGIKKGQFCEALDIEATTIAVFSLVSFASLDWAVFHSNRSKDDIYEAIKMIFFRGLVKGC